MTCMICGNKATKIKHCEKSDIKISLCEKHVNECIDCEKCSIYDIKNGD